MEAFVEERPRPSKQAARPCRRGDRGQPAASLWWTTSSSRSRRRGRRSSGHNGDRPEDGGDRDRRPRQRQERDRDPDARRFRRAGLERQPRDRQQGVHPDASREVGRRAGALFRYFNQFGDADPDELDVLICDEAHRIRHTSNNRFTPKHKRSTLPQVDELIQVAKVPVFLLDENQAVRPDEIGKVSVIEEAAERTRRRADRGRPSTGQFRCDGLGRLPRVGRAAARPRARRPGAVGGRRGLRARRLHERRASSRHWLRAEAGARRHRTDVRRVLLAVERPGERRHADRRRRRSATWRATVEREARASGSRTPQPPTTGRAIRAASDRSAASTRRRDSSTTTAA